MYLTTRVNDIYNKLSTIGKLIEFFNTFLDLFDRFREWWRRHVHFNACITILCCSSVCVTLADPELSEG